MGKKTMTNLKTRWKVFEKRVLDPVNASRIQRAEEERAFYAGAHAIMSMLEEIPENTPDKEAAEILQSIEIELNRYFSRFPRKKI
jgi:hypothetical protein